MSTGPTNRGCKTHLISNEENSSISSDNQLEVVIPIGILDSLSVPCVSSNDNNSSPGSIDSAKITTYRQSQFTPQIS